MKPSVAIVGRPNVGKSTLFNRIIGERLSITDDQPGITRDRIYSSSEWLTRQFNVIDTGGIDFDDTPFIHEIKSQAEIAIDEADVIVLVCDIQTGITDDDAYIARMLYKSKKPVILAINKVDDVAMLDNLYEFYSLGLGEPIPVSSTHSVGVGDLLDKIIEELPVIDEPEYDESRIKFSVIGRPNVGKSSLTNALLGENRVIVSSIEGTTRDSIDSLFSKDDQDYVVIDTAGMRKKGKVYENAEKYSVLRALSAIDRSDICLLLIDAETGIREQDKRIAGYAIDAGKAIVIVVNKWDTIIKDTMTMKRWEQELRSHFQFITFAKIVFLSALTKQRINTLFPIINETFENYSRRVRTSVLNDVITDALLINPPKSHNGEKIKVYYATQVSNRPPTFVLFVNDENCMHFSYKRYLTNRLRESFKFEGTPIKIILRKRD